MIFPRPPYLLRLLTFGTVNWRIPVKDKCVFLTFDDGPIPGITPWVLKTLATYDAHATFFCVGNNVNKHPDIYKQILADGHRTGNHSFDHIKAWNTPNSIYMKNVSRAGELINSRLFRPPHGQLTLPLISVLRKNFSIVLWSVLSYDFDQSITPEKCLAILIRYTRPGDIIVFHDSLKAEPRMKYALPRFLEYFHSKGFVFRSLPDSI